MKNTDLHNHSYYSDGQISPKGLVRLAKRRGIKNLSLTDHDSVKGVDEAVKEGKKIGVRVIPGVELRAESTEVLGYFINYKDRVLLSRIRESSLKAQEKTKIICNKLNKAGYKITFKELWKKFPKARGNINTFYLLYALYLKKYGTIRGMGDSVLIQFKHKIKKRTIIEAIRIIKRAGGVAVLAHPWLDEEILKESNIRKYVKAGLKGIEINNGDRAPLRSKSADKKMKWLAKKYNLIMTSGSDFHGRNLVKQMPGNHDLGKNSCDESVVYELEKLRTRKK